MRTALYVAILATLIITYVAVRSEFPSILGTSLLVFILGMLYRGVFAGGKDATSWGREKGESLFAFACRRLGQAVRRWRKSRYRWLQPEEGSDADMR